MALGQFILAQCYDLAKWLSHYLIFLFLFFSFITKVEHRKILCDKSQSHKKKGVTVVTGHSYSI